jgi:ABC-2 type transport system permease protein
MTKATDTVAGSGLAVRQPSLVRGALALAERDLILVRRGIFELALRSLFQPFLFVLVFTYVYPKIGTNLAFDDGLGISTIVVGGLAAFSAMFCGVYAVGMPLAVDLGLTREVDDRALAPIRTLAIPLVRMASGAVQAGAAALLVPFMIVLIAVESPDTSGWSPILALLALIVSGLCVAAMGLVVAGLVPTASLPAVLTILPMPLTFLGAGYYSWASLGSVPALKAIVLLNPVTWVSESFRAALTPAVPHMHAWLAIPGTLVWAVLLGAVGSIGVARRIESQAIAL